MCLVVSAFLATQKGLQRSQSKSCAGGPTGFRKDTGRILTLQLCSKASYSKQVFIRPNNAACESRVFPETFLHSPTTTGWEVVLVAQVVAHELHILPARWRINWSHSLIVEAARICRGPEPFFGTWRGKKCSKCYMRNLSARRNRRNADDILAWSIRPSTLAPFNRGIGTAGAGPCNLKANWRKVQKGSSEWKRVLFASGLFHSTTLNGQTKGLCGRSSSWPELVHLVFSTPSKDRAQRRFCRYEASRPPDACHLADHLPPWILQSSGVAGKTTVALPSSWTVDLFETSWKWMVSIQENALIGPNDWKYPRQIVLCLEASPLIYHWAKLESAHCNTLFKQGTPHPSSQHESVLFSNESGKGILIGFNSNSFLILLVRHLLLLVRH